MDKWLWAARLFKTRSLAADAIKGGKVKIDGNPVKPSREVKEGDVIQVQIEQLHKVVQVKTVIKTASPPSKCPRSTTTSRPRKNTNASSLCAPTRPSGATVALGDRLKRNGG